MHRAAWICLIVLVSFEIASGAAEARPKVYIELRGVLEPAGTKPSLKDTARALLLKTFEKDPRVATSLGDPAPKGDDLIKVLKSKRIDGYALVLRITKATHTMNPPPPGKVYKVLMVDVAVAIDAEKIPSSQMALAGEGSAQVGTEVSRLKEQERVQLLNEALVEAIKQAAVKSIVTLTTPTPAQKKGRGGRKRRTR